MANEMVREQPKSVMIDPKYNNRSNRKRMEADEKELEELMKLESEGVEPENETSEVLVPGDTAPTEIRKVHTDFDTLKGTDAFHDWVDEQSKWIKDALYDNQDDSKAVIRVIDLYKMDNNLTPAAKKQNARDAASDVRAKGGPTKLDADGSGKQFSESQVARESDRWYAENEDAIMAAISSGNFKYDMQK